MCAVVGVRLNKITDGILNSSDVGIGVIRKGQEIPVVFGNLRKSVLGIVGVLDRNANIRGHAAYEVA